mgnify:CR=1 FL=1
MKKDFKKQKSTFLKKDGKEYCVHPELKDDNLFQITATGIEHGFKTIYQKDFTLRDLKSVSKYFSNQQDIESIANNIIGHLEKKDVELANRGDTIELYINISPEEEICLILNKIFVDASMLKDKNQELLEEIYELQASINLLKEDLEKKIKGLKDASKLANKLKKEKDELDIKLKELERNLKEKDELIGELEEDVLEYKKVNKNLSSKCERLEGELSENENLDNQSELEMLRKENDRLRNNNDYKLRIEELEEELKIKEKEYRDKLEGLEDKIKYNDDDEQKEKIKELEEKLEKQKEINKKMKINQKSGDQDLLKEIEEMEEEYQIKIKNTENNYETQLNDLKDELNKLKEQNKKLKQNQKNDNYERRIVELEEELRIQVEKNKKFRENKKEGEDDLNNKIFELEDSLNKQIEINKQLKIKIKNLEDEYENKIKDLQDQIKKLMEQNRKLKMDIKNLENEKRELEDLLNKSQDQNKKLKLSMKKMEEEYEEKIRELEAELKKLKDENKKLKQRIKEIEDEYEYKIRELENKYKRMEKEYKNKILELQEELRRKEELIKKLKNKNNKLIDENENLKIELERLRDELRQKEKIIDSLKNIRKDFETPNKDKKGKKVRKTSITKVITKTKKIKNLGETHYISTTPTKNYKFMLTSDNKPIIRTSYECVTKTQNGIGNSKYLSEQNKESLQNYDNNETEENSYIIKSRFSQNRTNLNPIFNTIDKQILSEEEVVEISDVIERENELNLIKDKLGKSNLSLALLYKASRDGDDAEIFHSRVDNIKNNITFIKTNKGVRFGGFTKQSWDGNNIFKEDDSAFIFSLTKLKTYDVNQKESAIWCYPNNGPIFGGYQIDIFDRFMSRDSNKTGKKGSGYDTYEDFELNNGEKNFVVDELEVYEIQDL